MDKIFVCRQIKVKAILILLLSLSFLLLIIDFKISNILSTLFFLLLTVIFFLMNKRYIIIDDRICEFSFSKEIYSIELSKISKATYSKSVVGEKYLRISSSSIDKSNGRNVDNEKTLLISTDVTNFDKLVEIIENYISIR